MRAAPHTVFVCAMLIFIACVLGSSVFVKNTPWIGFTLVAGPDGALMAADVATNGPAAGRTDAGDVIAAIHGAPGQRIPLHSALLRSDPDTFGSYVELDAFLEELTAVHAVLRSGTVGIERMDGRIIQVQAASRMPLSAVPIAFWYQVLWAGVSFLLVASVWSFRPDSPTARAFAVAGSALSAAMLCAAVYSAHGLGMDGRLLSGFLNLAHLSLYTSLASLLSLCWVYPKPLPASGAVSISFFVFAGLWWIVDFLRVLPTPVFGPAVAQLIAAGIALLVILLRTSSASFSERSGNRSLWLCVAAVASLYLVSYPGSLLLLGSPLLERQMAMSLLHLVFLGIGLGIYMRSLFQIDRWVWSLWVFFGVSVATLALDMLVVYALGLASERVFAVSAMLLAWLYFPIRQLVWARASGRLRRGDYRDVVPGVVEELLVMRIKGEQERAWFDVLERLWAPLILERAADTPRIATLGLGGVELHLPAIASASAVVMRHADRGGRLFSAEDVRFADTLVLLAHKIAPLQDAARSGAAAERRRVASDLHDHVMPALLSFVYRADQTQAATAGRAAIQQLRQLIRALEVPAGRATVPYPEDDL